MPLKVIVCPIAKHEEFAKTVDEALLAIQQDFLAFNRKHAGKQAEVSRSVTFHVTESNLVCILYYMWQLAQDPRSGLMVVPPLPGRGNSPPGIG